MTSQLTCPLTVKMRIGWDEKKPNADIVSQENIPVAVLCMLRRTFSVPLVSRLPAATAVIIRRSGVVGVKKVLVNYRGGIQGPSAVCVDGGTIKSKLQRILPKCPHSVPRCIVSVSTEPLKTRFTRRNPHANLSLR